MIKAALGINFFPDCHVEELIVRDCQSAELDLKNNQVLTGEEI